MGISIQDSSGSDARTGSSTSSDPDKVDSLADYANFLRNIRRDYARAEEMFERAITADSTNVINLGNYANFLRNVRRDYDRAEEMYERAITADPNHGQ